MKNVYAFLTHDRENTVCLRIINAMALPTFSDIPDESTRSIDWWNSPSDFFAGKTGATGHTIEMVRRHHPGLIVFHDRKAATRAFNDARNHPDVIRLYHCALDVFHADCERDLDSEDLADDLERGIRWLFGASNVLKGDAHQLAWDAHLVFYP